MFVHALIHGEHIPDGDDPHNYDGHITQSAKDLLRKIELPNFQKIFCGCGLRFLETAGQIIAIDLAHFHMIGAVGNDTLMFEALRSENEMAAELFLSFLAERKESGLGEVIIITSPFYPLAAEYWKRGGIKFFGRLPSFVNEKASRIKGGDIITFEI